MTGVAVGNRSLIDYTYRANNGLLSRADSGSGWSQTVTYSYDLGGNLQTVKKYAYTTGNLNGLTPVSTDTYSYTDSSWRDLLTAYNGHSISYDQNGNPTTYHNGLSFT